jgi:hypothetical protein
VFAANQSAHDRKGSPLHRPLDGWQPESDANHGFAILNRNGERRLLMITARDPEERGPKTFSPFRKAINARPPNRHDLRKSQPEQRFTMQDNAEQVTASYIAPPNGRLAQKA